MDFATSQKLLSSPYVVLSSPLDQPIYAAIDGEIKTVDSYISCNTDPTKYPIKVKVIENGLVRVFYSNIAP